MCMGYTEGRASFGGGIGFAFNTEGRGPVGWAGACWDATAGFGGRKCCMVFCWVGWMGCVVGGGNWNCCAPRDVTGLEVPDREGGPVAMPGGCDMGEKAVLGAE